MYVSMYVCMYTHICICIHYIIVGLVLPNINLLILFDTQVHACDVVRNMGDKEVKNVNDFEWISQLRFDYYIILLHKLYI